MTREEQIKKFAQELGKKYFPNSDNIWARPNIEAQRVTSACIEMVKWMDEHSFEEGAKWADKHPNLTQEEQVGMSGLGMEWQKKHLIDKACRCYCDNICDKSRCGMCFHKYDGEHQIKKTFKYDECNELKLFHKTMEE